MDVGRITPAPGGPLGGLGYVQGGIRVEGRTFDGTPIEQPQIERITNTIGTCIGSLDDAVRRLHGRIDRLDGGVPECDPGQGIKPSRNGQLGILEDQAEALHDLLGTLAREISRLERL